ncbi:MAG: hypothetical protein Pars93KO_28400 [Parasphingorhabdus sp.]
MIFVTGLIVSWKYINWRTKMEKEREREREKEKKKKRTRALVWCRQEYADEKQKKRNRKKMYKVHLKKYLYIYT